MKQYGKTPFGAIHKYGKYEITGGNGNGGFQIGPHTRYRMRYWDHEGKKSEYIVMCESRVSVKGKPMPMRMRANNDEWAYLMTESIRGNVPTVRIRSVGSDGESEWVYGVRANLNKM